MCPTEEELCRYLGGEMGEAEAARIEAHLQENCPRCDEVSQAIEDAGGGKADGGLIASMLIRQAPVLPGPRSRVIDSIPGDGLRTAVGSPGLLVGRYKLLKIIGGGGMGVVYLAEQSAPVRRMVALKVIKAGMDSRQVIARFRAEQQALAMMDHPNIAKVLDFGETESGRPYFVMELVKGIPITRYCDEQKLTPRERLELFIPVCQAVQHAHQKGIIHRDIKPSNVLVGLYGGNAVPKVIDFGVAKATGQKLAEESLFTEFGAVVGTLEYMSPEQAQLDNVDIDTRCDVYSLGVLLYELLTGTTPLDRGRLKQAALLEVLRLIREEDPPWPSTRLSTADALPSIAASRGIEPRSLSRLMRCDLDWIVMKALEKPRADRYETAGALARDVERYLAGDPVEARPPSAAYRLRKFARKYRAALTTAALAAALLVTGGATSAWQAYRLRKEQETIKAALAAEQKALAAQTEQRELAEQLLYDARMNLIQRYWEDYHGALFKRALHEQILVNQRGIDRRGWEWYYWLRTFSSGHITLNGHTGPVTSVAFSPAGRRLASVSRDGTVTVRDAATGQEIRTFGARHTKVVTSLAFSPDGRRLASASFDGTVKVCDAATGQETFTFKKAPPVMSMAFSPDGQQLASPGDGNAVAVRDAATGQEIRTLKGHHTNPVTSVVFSPDGQSLASADMDGTVELWDVATGQGKHILKGHTAVVWSMVFSPDGRWLASASRDGTVKVWNAGTGQEVRTLKGHTGPVRSVAFSPDGNWLASGSFDNTVKVWDFGDSDFGKSTTHFLTLKGHNDAVTSVAFSPDGQQLASADFDGKVELWDFRIAQETLTLKGHAGAVTSVAFSPDGRRLASTGKDWTVRVWNAETGQETLTLKEDLDFETRIRKNPTFEAPSVAFSPDGRRIAAASSDHNVSIRDAVTGQETLGIKGHTGPVTSVAFSPDGWRLASVGRDGTVTVWEAATGREIRTLKGVCSVAFSPDGGRLASVSEDQTVKVCDAATGQQNLAFKGHSSSVQSVAFSPDGRWLASASGDGTVKVWDARTGQETLTLEGHTGPVLSVAFSPNGQRLASASEDQTVKVWDARTGQETLTLKGHTGSVTSVAFSPDGWRLASASSDGTVKIWDARPLDAEPTQSAPMPH
jgi:eukaryotic-like serine/threonine-protein kinase